MSWADDIEAALAAAAQAANEASALAQGIAAEFQAFKAAYQSTAAVPATPSQGGAVTAPTYTDDPQALHEDS